MGVTRFPRFENGVAINDMPVLAQHGNNVYWVHSGTGSNSNPGTFLEPRATIDSAVNLCTANKGDIVMVKAGHAETITGAAGIDADVAGISIIGLGNGTNMPTVTFTTATTADVDIDAANVTIKNIRFVCGIDSQTAMIDVNDDHFTIDGCEFTESSATGLTCIDINGGAANACDYARVLNCSFHCETAGNWDRAIELGEVAQGIEIAGNTIIGDFDDAGIHNITGKVLTQLNIHDNVVHNLQSGQHAIELVSACTGSLTDNRLYSDAYSTTLDPGSLKCSGNLASNAVDEGGVTIPVVADVADNYIGTDDSNNAAATTNVAANEDGSVLERLEQIQEAVNKGTGTAAASNKSVLDAIGFDGNAAITATAGMLRVAAGTTFAVKKTLTSSAIVQAGVDVTGVSSGGDLSLIEFTVMSDGTGLASGTNLTFETNNAKGLAVFFTEAVADIGANKTENISLADAGSHLPVVESGKKIIAKCTTADCTGSGTIDVYMVFRRHADGATIAAA